MTFFCIADRESDLGFRLAGMETRSISTRSEALAALKVSLAVEGVGIIIITEKAASFIRQEIDNLLYRQQLPLILEVPSRGEIKRRKSAAEFLKEMVGLSI
jgi:V/A-type H+-transporting ATPase subunit F